MSIVFDAPMEFDEAETECRGIANVKTKGMAKGVEKDEATAVELVPEDVSRFLELDAIQRLQEILRELKVLAWVFGSLLIGVLVFLMFFTHHVGMAEATETRLNTTMLLATVYTLLIFDIAFLATALFFLKGIIFSSELR